MKKILLILSVLLIANSSSATHLMGGEITWNCIKTGSNTGSYVFTLKIYRDCQGVSLNTFNYLTVHNVSGLSTIPLNYISASDLSPLCDTLNGPNNNFSCGGSNIGFTGNGNGAVEEHVFQSDTIRILGTPDLNGWHFTWSDCCRNNALTNIMNPGSTGFTLRAVMYPYTDSSGVVYPNNGNCYDSSPKFYEKPRTILEVGNGYDPLAFSNGFTYSHNAFDQEQDSIRYEWGQPLNDLGYDFLNPNSIAISFNSPFSYTSPINGINLNNITGRTSYPADQQGNFVTCTKVSSFKCGQLVSEIFRELQIVLIPPTCNLGDTTNGNFGADTLCNIRPLVQPPFYYPSNVNQYQWDTIVHCGDTVAFDFIATDNDIYPNGNQQDLLFEVSGGQFYNYNDNIPCQNPPCATFTESISGATPPFITPNGSGTGYFEWITSCNHIINSCASYKPTVYTFVIRVTDDYCPAPAIENTSQVISITVYPPCDIKPNAVSSSADCSINNGSIDVFPSGGYGPYSTYFYDLNGSAVNPDSLFSGIYLVNLVDSTLCEITDTIVVGENNLSASVSFTTPLCYGDSTASASIYVSGGSLPYTYTWYPINQNTFSISNIPAGQYIVSVSDSNNCSRVDTFLIDQPLVLSIDDSLSDASCFGNSDGFIYVLVNGGVFPYSYDWSTGATTQNIDSLTSGSYQLTITDSNNCILVEDILINQPDDLFAFFNLNYVSCFGLSDGSIDGTTIGGTPPFSYIWNNGVVTEDLNNIPSDMYILSLTDANNCFFTDTIVVFEPDLLQASITYSSGNLVSIGSGGTLPYTYEIYNPNGLFATTSNNMGVSFTINPLITGIYTLIVTDMNGCIDSSEVNVEPSSLYDYSFIENLSVYPNPSKDLFNLTFESSIKQDITLSIYNILGENIFRKNISSFLGEYNTSFNLLGFGKSMYMLEIKTNQTITNKKIILE